MMKKSTVLFTALVVCALSLQAYALLPAYNNQIAQLPDEPFVASVGSGSATVTSTVYDLVGGGYLYTYEIKNVNHVFTWFSVMLDGVAITGSGSEPGVVSPAIWQPANAPLATSVDALFVAPSLSSTNPSSVILWFTSPEFYAIGDGALAGTNGQPGGYSYVSGRILTPQVPEPATMILLGVGLLALRKVGRKSCY